MKNTIFTSLFDFIKKIVLYVVKHFILYIIICIAIVIIATLLTWDGSSIYNNIFILSYENLVHSTFGNGVLVIGFICYVFALSLYESIIGIYEFRKLKENTVSFHLVLSVISLIGILSYATWFFYG